MKAFVTGASGFLGSHLVDLLLQEGHAVSCLVRKTSNLRWLKNKPIRLVVGDLTPEDPALKEGLKDADWCFHAAGLISTPHPEEYLRVNAGGTRHCLEACLQSAPRLRRFVLVSSVAASGPVPEGQTAVDENTPPRPLTAYGQSKLEAEKIVCLFQDRLPVSIIRPPAIYGPRDRMMLPIFRLAKRGLFFVPGCQGRTISLAYVEDVARACLWAAQSVSAAGKTFFVADGEIYTWGAVADVLAAILNRRIWKIPLWKSVLFPLAFLEEQRARWFGAPPRMHRGHILQFFRSWGIRTDQIRAAGFVPKFNLEAGMRAAVAGYRQLGWL